MAHHSSTLAWKIPWMEEPGRLQSMGSRRVGHDWATFHFHALEKEMATHSSVLAWRIPGTGEPGGLPSTGRPHRVGHDWSDLAAAAAASWIISYTRNWDTRQIDSVSFIFSSKLSRDKHAIIFVISWKFSGESTNFTVTSREMWWFHADLILCP